jgi:hypothetical protein
LRRVGRKGAVRHSHVTVDSREEGGVGHGRGTKRVRGGADREVVTETASGGREKWWFVSVPVGCMNLDY